MNSLKEKLSKMTDKELAILVKFRINDYLMPTQLEIYDYIKERKLTPNRITQLTSDYNETDLNKKPLNAFQKLKCYFREVLTGIIEGL